MAGATDAGMAAACWRCRPERCWSDLSSQRPGPGQGTGALCDCRQRQRRRRWLARPTPGWRLRAGGAVRRGAGPICHLNGLALDKGRVRYVTVVSASDVVDGWRDRRRDGGCVLEVPSGEVLVRSVISTAWPWTRDGCAM